MRRTRWQTCAETDVGTVRKINEDSYVVLPDANIWCVADGMGGHSKGDMASTLITTSLREYAQTPQKEITIDGVVACIKQVNQHLNTVAQSNKQVIGSTVAILMFSDKQAHCLWAGDSRIYRLRNNHLQRLTRDHSQVEEMINAGILDRNAAEEHPKANIITRAVGAASSLELEILSYDLAQNDQFILCSDGLNKVLSDVEISLILQYEPGDNPAFNLLCAALDRKTNDNVTCITVVDENAAQSTLNQTLPLDCTLPIGQPSAQRSK